MRSIKFVLSTENSTGWDVAVRLTAAYLSENSKANQLLDRLPTEFVGEKRAACQSLFLGALRHGHQIRAALKAHIRRGIRAETEAIFLVAGYEILSGDDEKYPKIIHHAVERGKKIVTKGEQGFLNAVLRKLPNALNTVSTESNPAARYSHPDWLVAKWIKEFGLEAATQLLEWNQQIPATYIKLYTPSASTPPGLESTDWPGFYRILPGANWETELYPLLNQGTAYIKDPSTRLAPELLAPKAGEKVLDLCAAPGGKAYDLAHHMQRKGQIIAVDLPGSRINRLQENLNHLTTDALPCTIVESDLLDLDSAVLTSHGAPELFDAVMLDAPCSNTGVIQRRTDVKWRLQPGDIKRCTKLQKELLLKAAEFVQPGGRLVYSTCSIETAENRAVVDTFLQSALGQQFALIERATSYPWQTGHDGAGAFLLRRNSES